MFLFSILPFFFAMSTVVPKLQFLLSCVFQSCDKISYSVLSVTVFAHKFIAANQHVLVPVLFPIYPYFKLIFSTNLFLSRWSSPYNQWSGRTTNQVCSQSPLFNKPHGQKGLPEITRTGYHSLFFELKAAPCSFFCTVAFYSMVTHQ